MTPLREAAKTKWVAEIRRIHRDMQNGESTFTKAEIDRIRDDMLLGAESDPTFKYEEGQMLDSTYSRLSVLYPSHSSRLWFQFQEDWAQHLEAFIIEFNTIVSRHPRCAVRLIDQSVSNFRGYWFQLEWTWLNDEDKMSLEDSSALVKAANILMNATRPTKEPKLPLELYR